MHAERTTLAWSLTGLAVLVNILLALRSGRAVRKTPIPILAFALFIVAIAVLCGAWWCRYLVYGHGRTALSVLSIAVATVVTLLAYTTRIAAIAMH